MTCPHQHVCDDVAERGLADLTGVSDGVVRLDPRVSGVGPRAPLPLARSQYDVDVRLSEMDAVGVERHAVSLPPFLFCSTADERRFAADIVAQTLADECQLIVVASWQRSPFIRLVQPPNGGGFTGGPLGLCGNRLTTRLIPAGDTLHLAKAEDLVLSDVLGETFEPGRFVISAIFVDEFIYEVLALDTQIPD